MRTNNGKYVDRGRMLVMRDDFEEWSSELKHANRRKNGAPFRYADAMIASVAIVRSLLQLPYTVDGKVPQNTTRRDRTAPRRSARPRRP